MKRVRYFSIFHILFMFVLITEGNKNVRPQGVTARTGQMKRSDEFKLPQVEITAYNPKGLQISIAHEQGIEFINIKLNINKELSVKDDNSMFSNNLTSPIQNRWIFYFPTATLRINQIIYYTIIVGYKSKQFNFNSLSHVIKKLTTQRFNEQIMKCNVTSITKVKNRNKCKGELLFEDHFDDLDSKKWLYNIKVADAPDYEFCLFDQKQANSFIEDGSLTMLPTLTENVYGKQFMTNGTLNLDECTGVNSNECRFEASSTYNMPAIISTQLRSTFSFLYGKIEIKARMAEGDWLLSKLTLEPARRLYGANYNSGEIRIASSRGNNNLKCEDELEYGNQLVECGVIFGTDDENIHKELNNREFKHGYNSKFVVYKVEWTPEKIVCSVDGKVVSSISPPAAGFYSYFEETTSERNPWENASLMAPFDIEFTPVITLAAGGIRDFPDSCINKPWRNSSPKAQTEFYKNQTVWSRTIKSGLKIDYIKIYAI